MMVTGKWGGPCVENHSVYIADRGGTRRVAQLMDISEIRWDRRRDETSEAQVLVRGAACSAQAEILANIEPKRSEIVIFRGTDRVWEGPVGRVGWHSDHVEIAAKDVSDYIFGRPLSQTWNNAHPNTTTVTARMAQILNWELEQPFTYLDGDGDPVTVPAWEDLDPPANVLPHVVVHHSLNEVRTAAVTTPFQMTVGEHLDNYARTGGIDYTVVGRALHIWDVSRSLGRLRTLTEADFFGEIIITAYGADFASIAFAVAEDGSYGGAGVMSDYYGPWSKIFTVNDEDESDGPTQAELNSQAMRNLYGRSPVPIEVRVPDNSSIRLDTGLTIDMLVPGVHIPLLATLNSRQVSQVQKLHQVVVTETSEGETVQVTLLPATRPDSDVEDEE